MVCVKIAESFYLTLAQKLELERSLKCLQTQNVEERGRPWEQIGTFCLQREAAGTVTLAGEMDYSDILMTESGNITVY